MSSRITLSIQASLSDVRLIGEAVRSLCSSVLSSEKSSATEICVVEAANNVILHAYGEEGEQELSVTLEINDEEVVVKIFDRGKPLPQGTLELHKNALQEIDLDNLDDLPEGGMGIALIQSSMDDVHYERRDGINSLTMKMSVAETG